MPLLMSLRLALLVLLCHYGDAFQPLTQNVTLDLKNHFHAELKNNDIFHGQVEVTGLKRGTNSVISLNAWKIDVFAVNVTCDNKQMEITKLIHQKSVDDTIRIEFERNITDGEKCFIWIEYDAPFSILYGLFKSYWPSKYEHVEKTVSIATNNEPELARLWTPCFDSMEFLTNWTVIIEHPKHTRVLGMNTVTLKKFEKHYRSTLKSIRPWQASKVAFAVIEEKRFKTYSVVTETNQTLRLWFPRNITFRMRAKDILSVTRDYFDSATKLFDHVLKCKNIEFVVLQHRSDLTSGCLVILDQRYDLTVQQLRTSIAKLWLGSEILYSSTQEAWFTHSLSHYLGRSYSNWTQIDRLKLLYDTVDHPRIIDEPIVSKYTNSWNSRDLYPTKGTFIISMIADVMTVPRFREMIKSLLARFSEKFFNSDRLFYLVREFTERKKWPACYRAFLGTQTDFVGLPVVTISRENNTATITQHNFEIKDRDDYRFRPWFYSSEWTNPLWITVNDSTNLWWLNHDDGEIRLDVTNNESLFVDSETRGLYLVEYAGNYLFEMWNQTQDCSRFNRFCVDRTINGEFCLSVYKDSCSVEFPPSRLVFDGYRHHWEKDE